MIRITFIHGLSNTEMTSLQWGSLNINMIYLSIYLGSFSKRDLNFFGTL